MGMPKVKPDNVIRHEIVLGRADRELLSGAVAAYQVNRISTPLVALMSDVSAMYVLATIVELFGKDIEWLPTIADVPEGLEWLADQAAEYNAYRAQAQATPEGEDRPKPTTLGAAWYNLMNPNWGGFFGNFV